MPWRIAAARCRPARARARRADELLDLDVLAEAELEHEIAARPQAAGRPRHEPRDQVEAVDCRRTAPRPARGRGPPAAAPAAHRRATYGGFATIASNGPRDARRADRSARTGCDRRRRDASALRRATSSAAGEMSVATTVARRPFARERHRDAAAAGADIGDRQRRRRARETAPASASTISSVSGPRNQDRPA